MKTFVVTVLFNGAELNITVTGKNKTEMRRVVGGTIVRVTEKK